MYMSRTHPSLDEFRVQMPEKHLGRSVSLITRKFLVVMPNSVSAPGCPS